MRAVTRQCSSEWLPRWCVACTVRSSVTTTMHRRLHSLALRGQQWLVGAGFTKPAPSPIAPPNSPYSPTSSLPLPTGSPAGGIMLSPGGNMGMPSSSKPTVLHALALLGLVLLTWQVVACLSWGSITNDTTTTSNMRASLPLWQSAVVDPADDLVDPAAWVRQWHIAEPTKLYRPLDTDLPQTLPALSEEVSRVPFRCSPAKLDSCSDIPLPTAHRVGLGNYPSLMLPTLGEEQLAAVWSDAKHRAKVMESVAAPWQIRLTALAARFDLPTGDFLVMLSIDDAHAHLNGTDEDQLCHGSIHAVHDRRRALWDHLLRSGTDIRCLFSDGDDLASAPAAEYMMGQRSEVVELRCPYPWHPRSPPHALNLTLQMEFSPKMWPSTTKTTARMLVPLKSELARRVSVAYCGKPLANTMPLGFMLDFIQHHVMLGVEVFHIYDRYNQPAVRARLQPHIDSGLVVLHDVPEHTHFYTRGVPSPMAIYYSQVAYQEVCRYHNFASAEYVVSWDFDEYLHFPTRLHPENLNLTYSKPNGRPVHVDPIEQTPPSCVRRNISTGLLQMDYSHVDLANAAHDAEAGWTRSEIVADTMSEEVRHNRTVQCTSMVTQLVDSFSSLHSQTFDSEPDHGASRRVNPWFILLPTVPHHFESSRVASERESFREHASEMIRDEANHQLLYSAELPREKRSTWSEFFSRSPAKILDAPDACPVEVAPNTVFRTNFISTAASSATGSRLPNASDLHGSCFVREDFQFPSLLRFPVPDWEHGSLPKFLLRTRARAASWVHWPSSPRSEETEHGWSILMRNYHRAESQAKRETPTTAHAPPVAELLHFLNLYTTRTARANYYDGPETEVEASYHLMAKHIQKMPCANEPQHRVKRHDTRQRR